MTWLNILDRFRPVGAPGASGPVGVPSADVQGPAAELAVVFAALTNDVESCRTLIAEAKSSSEEDLSRARDQAAAIVAQANLDAGAERESAAARVKQAAKQQDDQLSRQATADAAILQKAGAARLPALVAEIIKTLTSEESIR
ncbi:MAG TPA: hypothetical protein VMV52_05770 [Candidatus Nanopelagicaceae bacterium]|nr:hypothetical protein [Candidatus Nanopelagicaceae bacterium]